ncbi:hypothetical protein DL764_007024 [Monosporascus ibericus]|uniref:Heterokaryon incompatibility domain-containing protein n=1 Tax=Monosporascus ibericus TaxID=155417 RepID=A0A4Q4T388_9PEZI|nr:hypothetical protein DL764_007024 [Monosporascus ibericus]
MNMELVLSRGCRHVDWCTIPKTSIEFCRSCGFALISTAGRPAEYTYAGIQVQPRPGDTFDPARSPPLGARSYQYRPLDLVHGRQIRVLVLKAGQPDDPLRCGLEHVNLQQGPIYEAVSYTWVDKKGDNSICRTIQCGHNDQFIGITKNCEAALLRLRRRDADRRLWVDAVCIDQSNIQERNHQVKNMIAIFRSALRVLVFLGEGSPTLGRLVDYMSNDTSGQLPRVLDFTSLFQSRWFHRVWVLQEVAVAKSVLVIYGANQMSWVDFIEHVNLFLRLMAAHNFRLVLPPVISYGLRQTTMEDRRLQGRSDLLSLLQVSRNCSCEDARDKVYVIMGLLQDESVLPLRADYSPSTTAGWVFLQAAAWHISTTKSLETLSQMDGMSAINMPSWVPDWTRKSPTPLPVQFEVTKEFPVPRITSLDGQPLSPTATLDYPLECVLQVTGGRCGTVWTDRRIFGKALVHSNSTSGATADDELDLHASYLYSRESGVHWLHNPSQNPGTQCCDERLDFWRQILSEYHCVIPSSDFMADDKTFRADIPPAFGGFCSNCFERDKLRREMIEQVIKQAIKLTMTERTMIENTTKKAIQQATKNVFKQATKDAFEQVTKNAFEQVIEHTIEQAMIENATKKAIQRATKNAFKQSTKNAFKQSTKNTFEQATKNFFEQVIEQAMTERAMIENAAKNAIQRATKNAFKQATKNAFEQAIKQAKIDKAVVGVSKQAIMQAIMQAMIKRAMTKKAMTKTAKATAAMTKRAVEKIIEKIIEKAIEKAIELARKRKAMIEKVIERASSKIPCCCVSLSPSLGHFDKDKLEGFITKMNQYGMSRRIFGTDHSLGFGPMELEDWDEVWMLEGARVPFILRPVDDHYRLVGACYLHQVSQTTDRCSLCSYQTVRKEITLRQKPRQTTRQKPHAQPATNTTARKRPLVQRQSSRGEEHLTRALPGRLKQIEIR